MERRKHTFWPGWIAMGIINALFVVMLASCGGQNSLGPDDPLDTPGGFRIVAIGDGKISLEWQAEEGVASYAVYRSEGATTADLGPFVRIATTTEPRFEDRTLVYENEYRYQITSLAGERESVPTDMLGGQPLNLLPPQGVQNLTAYARNIPQLDHLDISLVWDPNTVDADLLGYQIFRNTTATFPLDDTYLIDSTQTTTAFVDQSIEANVEYTFQIVAIDKGGKQSNPVPISVVALKTPELVTPVSDAVVTTSQVQLTWSETGLHQPVGYVVYLSTSPVFSDADQFELTDLTLIRETNRMTPGRYYWQVGSYTDSPDRIVALSMPSSFIVQR